MAIGNYGGIPTTNAWRPNPNLGDLNQYIGAPMQGPTLPPNVDPAYLAWRQSIAARGPSNFVAPAQPPPTMAQVGREALMGPQTNAYGEAMPVGPAFRQAIQPQVSNPFATDTAAQALGARPPMLQNATPFDATQPLATPEGITAGLHPQTEAWNSAMAARDATAIARATPPPAADFVPGMSNPATTPMSYADFPNVASQALGRNPPPGPNAFEQSFPEPPGLAFNPGGGTIGNAFNIPNKFGAEGGPGIGGAVMNRLAAGSLPGMTRNFIESHLGAAQPGSVGANVINSLVPTATTVGYATGNPLLAGAAGLAAANNTLQNADPTNQKLEQVAGEHGVPGWATRIGENVLGAVSGNAAGRNDVGGKIVEGLSKIGGWLGGGGDSKAQAEAAAPDQQPQQDQNAAIMAKYNPDTLATLGAKMGLHPAMNNELKTQYNQNVAMLQAQGQQPVHEGDVILQSDYNKLDPDAKKKETRTPVTKDRMDLIKKAGDAGYTLPDAEFQAGVQSQAWQAAAQNIPQLAAQAKANDDYLTRQAALQAVIAPYIGQYFGQGQSTANDMQQLMGGRVAALSPALQGAGQNYLNVGQQGARNMGDATAASLAILPGLLNYQQQNPTAPGPFNLPTPAKSPQQQYQAVYQNQLNQKQAEAQLKLEHPEWYTSSSSSSNPFAP